MTSSMHQLVEYITKQRQKGVEEKVISQKLADVGWKRPEISGAFLISYKKYPKSKKTEIVPVEQTVNQEHDVSDPKSYGALLEDIRSHLQRSEELLKTKEHEEQEEYVKEMQNKYLHMKHFFSHAQKAFDKAKSSGALKDEKLTDSQEQQIKELKATVAKLVDQVGTQSDKLSSFQIKEFLNNANKPEAEQAVAATVTQKSEEPKKLYDDDVFEEQEDADTAQLSTEYKRPTRKRVKREEKKEEPELEEKSDKLEFKQKIDDLEQRFRELSTRNNVDDPSRPGYYNPIEEEEIPFVEEPVGDRVQTGLSKMDGLIDGGFPRYSNILISGGAGTGKSTLALQYLVNGILLYNEPGIYITFEQSKEAIKALGEQFGWDLDNLMKQKMLIIREYTPEQIDKILKSGGGSLRDMVEAIHARRFVMDSITEYMMMYESDIAQRKAITDLFKSLRKWGLTSAVIAEEESDLFIHRSSMLDYESDGVVVLYNERRGDIRQRAIEIFKMRGTKHAGRIFPLKIGDRGILINMKNIHLHGGGHASAK